MNRFPKFECSFAILDVKKGRRALAKHFEGRPVRGPCPPEMRVPVYLMGYVDDRHSADDGESTEFSMVVESIEIHPGDDAGEPDTFDALIDALSSSQRVIFSIPGLSEMTLTVPAGPFVEWLKSEHAARGADRPICDNLKFQVMDDGSVWLEDLF